MNIDILNEKQNNNPFGCFFLLKSLGIEILNNATVTINDYWSWFYDGLFLIFLGGKVSSIKERTGREGD